MNTPQPGQDEGWGWCIVLGAGLAQTAFGISGRTMGVYYIMFMTEFDSSATMTAIATGIPMLLWGILGPAATYLISKWSCRTVGALGGLFMVGGFVCASYVPDIISLCFTFSLFTGIGMSLSYAPCFIIVGEYFSRRKALAMGLQSTGSAIGAIAGPPLLFALSSMYGYAGTMLLVAGICMHMLIAAALYRSFKSHSRYARLKMGARKGRKRAPIEEDPDLVRYVEPHEFSDVSLKQEQENIRRQEQDGEQEREQETGFQYDKFSKTSDPTHPDRSNHQKNATTSKDSPGSKRKKKNSTGSKKKKKKEKKKEPALLHDTGFLAYMFVTLAAINAFGVNVNFLPAMATEKGIDVLASTLLLSVIGISDCVCRVPWGIMFDVPVIKRYRLIIYNTAMLVAGITIALFPYRNSYVYMVIIALIRGSCSGLFLSQRATVLGDLIGENRVPEAFGIQLLVTGVGTMTGRILGGLCRDYLGSYDYAFYGSGGLIFLTCLSFYTFLFANWDQLKKRNCKVTPSSNPSSLTTT